MFSRVSRGLLLAVFLTLAAGRAVEAGEATGVPVIEHAPVHSAIPGQSLTIRARISGGVPKSVTLLFATSKDAAPFRVPMSMLGPGVYTGSIPEPMLARLPEVYYYIEARDAADAPVETPWYTVHVRSGTGVKTGAGTTGVGTSASGESGGEAQSSWVKPALIGGGILAVGGVAYALSQSGGGGGDDGGGGGGGPTPAAGTYTGTDTTCRQNPDGTSTCESSGLTITISEQGVVQSDNLRDGQNMEASLSGSSFVLVGSVNEGGVAGEIQYPGTVVDQRIVGNIQGSASSSASNGVIVFSGNFSAVK